MLSESEISAKLSEFMVTDKERQQLLQAMTPDANNLYSRNEFIKVYKQLKLPSQ
jgi:hypothetical protein